MQRCFQHLRYLLGGTLAHDSDRARAGINEGLQAGVIFGFYAVASRAAESDKSGVLQPQFTRQREKLAVLGVGAGPATFDVLYAQLIQLVRNSQLVRRREGDAFPLGAVPERGIVKLDVEAYLPLDSLAISLPISLVPTLILPCAYYITGAIARL